MPKNKKKRSDDPEKKKVFQTFSQIISDISVSVSHLPDFGKIGEDGDLQASYFQETLEEWKVKNQTQDWIACKNEIQNKCRSMPLILLHLGDIVESLLKHFSIEGSEAREPIVRLMSALARDVRHELTPYFQRIFQALVDVIEPEMKNPEVLEQIFHCISFLFKYLAKYILKDIESYTAIYKKVFQHPKYFIRQFAGESFSFLLRRMKDDLPKGINVLYAILDEGDECVADAVSVVLFEAVKTIQQRYHSMMEDVMELVLDRLDTPLRRKAAKTTLLRMRNHAETVENSEPIIELLLERYDAAVAERVKSADDTIITFYLDLFVAWFYVKPRPRSSQKTGFDVFIRRVFAGVLKLLDAPESTGEGISLRELFGRLTCLYWRAARESCRNSKAYQKVVAKLFSGKTENELWGAMQFLNGTDNVRYFMQDFEAVALESAKNALVHSACDLGSPRMRSVFVIACQFAPADASLVPTLFSVVEHQFEASTVRSKDVEASDAEAVFASLKALKRCLLEAEVETTSPQFESLMRALPSLEEFLPARGSATTAICSHAARTGVAAPAGSADWLTWALDWCLDRSTSPVAISTAKECWNTLKGTHSISDDYAIKLGNMVIANLKSSDVDLRVATLELLVDLPERINRLAVESPGEYRQVVVREVEAETEDLVNLCLQVEQTAVSIDTERHKTTNMTRIANIVSRLPPCVATVGAVCMLSSQFSVGISTVWAPAVEALAIVMNGPAASSPSESKKKRKKKQQAKKAKRAKVEKEEIWVDESDNEDTLALASELAAGRVWDELVWSLMLDRIDFVQKECENHVAEEDTSVNLPDYGTVKKIVDRRYVDVAEAEEVLEPTLEERRRVMDELWAEQDPRKIDVMSQNFWFWKVIGRLFQDTVIEPVASVNADLSGARIRYVMKRFLQLFENHKLQEHASRGLKTRMVHALTVVASVPSIESYATKTLVSRLTHACANWMLLDPSINVQKTALQMLGNSDRLNAYIGKYMEHLEGMAGEVSMKDAMVKIVLDPEHSTIDVRDREHVLPLVLRILFSKLTKKVTKQGSPGKRRRAIFAYLGQIPTHEAHHILACMMQLVLVFRPADSDSLDLSSDRMKEIPKSRALAMFLKSAVEGSLPLATFDSTPLEDGAPIGFVWRYTVDGRDWFVSFDEATRIRRTDGFLAACGDVLTHLQIQVARSSEFMQQLFVTILQRSSTASAARGELDIMDVDGDADKPEEEEAEDEDDEKDADKDDKEDEVKEDDENFNIQGTSSHRSVLRQCVLRMHEILTHFPIPPQLESWTPVLKPMNVSLDYMLKRLRPTSGCVEMSYLVQFLIGWSYHPELYYLYNEFPTVLPTLFALPSGPAVLARVRSPPKVALSKQMVAQKLAKKRGNKHKKEPVTNTCSGGPVVEAIVNLVLRFSRGGIQDIKNLKKDEKKYRDVKNARKRRKRELGDTDDSDDSCREDLIVSMDTQKAWLDDGRKLLEPNINELLTHLTTLITYRKEICPTQPIATLRELDLLESVSQWCSDRETSEKLVRLICTALYRHKFSKKSLRQSMQLLALYRLVPLSSHTEPGATPSEVALLPRQLDRILPLAQDLQCRIRICEVIFATELSLRGMDAKTILAQHDAKQLDHMAVWKPAAEEEYTEIHIAHLLLALNSVRRSLVLEPEVDTHVMALETATDEGLLGAKRIPPRLLNPLVSHMIFVMQCEDIDFAVRHSTERFLMSMADRIAEDENAFVAYGQTDGAQLLQIVLNRIVANLRRGLRSKVDLVQQSNLKVLAHYVRTLGPLCPPAKEGYSPAVMLHTDILPFLHQSVKQADMDEGGDVFFELLHLQKHRRTRMVNKLIVIIGEGKLSRTTVENIMLPIVLSNIMQYSAMKNNFDTHLADTSLFCLQSIVQNISWPNCMQTIRYLAGLLPRMPHRENYIVKTICKVLHHFRFTHPDAVKEVTKDAKNDVSASIIKSVDKHREVDPMEAADNEENKEPSTEADKAPVEEEEEEPEWEEVPATQSDAEKAMRATIARNVKISVLPILKRIMWQQDKNEDSGVRVMDATGGKKKKKGPRGTIRVAVVGVMLHVIRYLPVHEFHSHLPKLIHMLTEGLLSRTDEHRHAARQATTQVVLALGSAYLPWLVREMRQRMTRGFELIVMVATAHSALTELVKDPVAMASATLRADFDTAVLEFIPLIEAELERLCDASRLEGEAEDGIPKQIPEARKVRSPDILLLLSRYASPEIVQVHLIQHLYSKLLEDRMENENWNVSGNMALSTKYLRRIEGLIQRSMDGLVENTDFDMAKQVGCGTRLLNFCVTLLKGDDTDALFKEEQKKKGNREFTAQVGTKGWVSTKKESAFIVQPGAASGRGVWHGQKKSENQKGFDKQARAKVVGLAGLRLMHKILKSREVDNHLKIVEDEIVPMVVYCFASSQDALFVSAAKCLLRLVAVFHSRGELFEPHAERIALTVLQVFRRASGQAQLSARLRRQAQQHGLGYAGSGETVNTCTKLISALLRKTVSADWFNKVHCKELDQLDVDPTAAKDALKQTFLEALLSQIATQLDHPALQPSALELLNRVLIRQKLQKVAVYECVDSVGELLIRTNDTKIAKYCANIYVEFMLDYPHADKLLSKKVTFLVRNLGFNVETGRRSVLNALHTLVLRFPQSLIAKRFAALIMVPAAARLPQETDATAHRMLQILLTSILEKVDGTVRNSLLDVVMKWQAAPQAVLKSALAETISLVPALHQDSLLPRLPVLLPALRGLVPEEPSSDLEWRIVYNSMKAFEKVAEKLTPADLDRQEDAAFFWDLLVGGIATHPHPWVRTVGLRLLGSYVTKKSLQSSFATSRLSKPFGVMKDLCSVFDSDFLEENPLLVQPLVNTTVGMVRVLLSQPELVEQEVKQAEISDAEGSDDESDAEFELPEDAEMAEEEPAKEDEDMADQETNVDDDAMDSVDDDKSAESDIEGDEDIDAKSVASESEDERPEDKLVEEVVSRSLFDEAAKETVEDEQDHETIQGDAELMQRARVRWTVVRLSFICRKFLSQPHKHVVGIATVFKFFGSLTKDLSETMVSSLLEPMLSPLFRSLSFGQKRNFNMSDITCSTQLVELSNNDRLGFIAALAQHVMNSIQAKIGNSKQYSQALQNIRKIVMRSRAERSVKEKQDVIANPVASANRRIKKNKRTAERKKEKLHAKLLRTKGGHGKMLLGRQAAKDLSDAKC